MMKRNGTKRSTLGLIASGIATIGIVNQMPTYRLTTTGKALKRDSQAIRGDARRASKAIEREYA